MLWLMLALNAADAEESTKQKHWNAHRQSHQGAGSTDRRGGQAAHGFSAELQSAGAVLPTMQFA